MTEDKKYKALLEGMAELTSIGAQLSTEKNTDKLLENILLGAKKLTNAVAGTLYSVTEDKKLKFETLRNDILNMASGGTTGKPITLNPVPMYDAEGNPNHKNIVSYAVLNNITVNIEDAYNAEGFDFAGTRAFDAATGFRSKSFLTVPLRNHLNEIIGCLQLINRKHPDNDEIVAFSAQDQRFAESLASQAAVALTNKRLIDDQAQFFDDFMKLIARTIDEKSPYTGGHCVRVPILAEMLCDAAMACDYGPLKDFNLTDDERNELHVAAWLHDCGKVTTPVHVMDKATKLETITDKIKEVDLRFEILKRDVEIEAMREKLSKLVIAEKEAEKSIAEGHPDKPVMGSPELGLVDSTSLLELEEATKQKLNTLEEERNLIRKLNEGGEFLSPEDKEAISRIGQSYKYQLGDEVRSLLNDDEIANLQIARGTLNDEERLIINNHIVLTLDMLNQLHYPKHLKNVPDIAGSHHERLDGKGYPRGLKGDEISMQARMLCIADVFEALSAADRPYKKPKSLTECLKILGYMCKDKHIDNDLFDLFIRNKIYLDYAKKFLQPEQIDEVDESKIPGYRPFVPDASEAPQSNIEPKIEPKPDAK